MQMENTTDILNELKELSPALAAMERVNVFTVPQGYFDQLAIDILMRVEAEQELKELSPSLAAIEKVNVFTVPQGYFDHLSSGILMGIENEAGLKTSVTNNAEVPEGYFDSLAGIILNKIKALETEDAATEIRTLSPMLYSIQNENVFEVPQGYFKNLTDDILDKVKPEVKVVQMPKRSSTILKYAVAAVFTGVMALGVFKFIGGTGSTELPDYVTAGLKIQNVDQELASISDEEIVKFLEADGTDIKTAMVANSIDQNELPSQEDYLLDEQALDKYLNSINVDELKN